MGFWRQNVATPNRPPRSPRFPSGLGILGVWGALAGPVACEAAVSVARLFRDGMVLQRDVEVPVWGWAADGEAVTVSIQGHSVATVAAAGRWQVRLPPLAVGGPHAMIVSGTNTLTFTNVLVGEVWISCGQSNMMMALNNTEGAADFIADSVNHPQVRQFHVVAAPTAGQDVGGSWVTAGPATVGNFSAVGYHFARSLNARLGVPIGMINAVEIVPAESWVDAQGLQADPYLAYLVSSWSGTRMYQRMIAPLQPYAIRGAIFYQGEYNADRGREYRRLLPALIGSWRRTWGQGDFPFLITQLSAFLQYVGAGDPLLDMPPEVLAAISASGGESAWAELREAQAMTADAVANTALAVTIDVGDPFDIHPRRKQPVGERLALAARSRAYGEALVHAGPRPVSLAVDGDALVLGFTSTGGGLVAAGGGPLTGFQISRRDGTLFEASAQILGDTVRLTSDEVPEPLGVRYGWANFPHCNLAGGTGLPASPFRALLPDRAVAADVSSFPLKAPGFETAGWELDGGASLVTAPISEGARALDLPVGQSAKHDDALPATITRYDWNSDPLRPATFRPGYVVGYSVDLAASAGAGRQSLYLRLCAHSNSTGFGYWGGVPEVATAGTAFSTRHVAAVLQPVFDIDGRTGAGAGVFLWNNSPSGPHRLFVDAFSHVHLLKPRLGLSDAGPIVLAPAPPGVAVLSETRSLFNAQGLTYPNLRDDGHAPSPVATILHGVARLVPAPQWGVEHVWGATDQTGATILGPDAARFEFAAGSPGATPRELRLIGPDGVGGLRGGPAPESEPLRIRFLGAPEPGAYSAFVRIVTQASNLGVVSLGGAEEPPEHFFYLDLPVTATVHPTFEYWLGGLLTPAQLADPAVADLLSDPDGDGALNLIEYALGGLPLDPASTGRPEPELFEHAGETRLRVTFLRRGDPRLVYSVWATSDLADWGGAPIWSSTGAANLAGPVTVTDVTVVADGSPRFLQVRVDLP